MIKKRLYRYFCMIYYFPRCKKLSFKEIYEADVPIHNTYLGDGWYLRVDGSTPNKFNTILIYIFLVISILTILLTVIAILTGMIYIIINLFI